MAPPECCHRGACLLLLSPLLLLSALALNCLLAAQMPVHQVVHGGHQLVGYLWGRWGHVMQAAAVCALRCCVWSQPGSWHLLWEPHAAGLDELVCRVGMLMALDAALLALLLLLLQECVLHVLLVLLLLVPLLLLLMGMMSGLLLCTPVRRRQVTRSLQGPSC